MKINCTIVLFQLLVLHAGAQVIPDSMRVDWSYSGLQQWYLDTNNIANVKNFGAAGDGVTNDYVSVINAINSLAGRSGIVFFPSGNYLIGSTINLSDSVTLKGEGAALTTLTFNLGGVTANCINIQRGQANNFVTVDSGYTKGTDSLFVSNASGLNAGDYAEIRENNGAWDTDPASWAAYSVGQIVRIDSLTGFSLRLNHALRIDYDSTLGVEIQKINPIVNVGLECFRITRVDSTAPGVNYMVYFSYAANCRMIGVESDHSLGAHIWAEASTSVEITGCYFHHAYIYDGTSTNGYGVAMAVHTGEFRIENNIFRHLRHSMIVKQGANGNVYAYNYSFDPNRTETPADAGADICLHGHYAFANLFEGNICQTVQIDSTWGPSGPYNTFFRNRVELYGIIMTPGVVTSDKDNFAGNDLTNTSFLHGLYLIGGSGHFTYGNNVLGTINPPGTNALPDLSYYLSSQPFFWDISSLWPDIGTPYNIAAETIPASARDSSGVFTLCGDQLTTGISPISNINYSENISLFPSLFSDQLIICINTEKGGNAVIKIYKVTGSLLMQNIRTTQQGMNTLYINTIAIKSGFYFVTVRTDSANTIFKCFKAE